ncbi:AfsR family transcriptional regulator, partial [Streptomyces sp. URMC 123]
PPLAASPLDAPPPMPPELLEEARRGVRLVELTAVEGDPGRLDDPRVRETLHGVIEAYRPGLPQTCRIPGVSWFIAQFLTGRYDALTDLMDGAVRGCRELGLDWELAFVLQLRAKLTNDRYTGQDRAHRDTEESLEIFSRLGDGWGTAEALAGRGESFESRGDFAAAAADYRRAMTMAEELGAHGQVLMLRTRLAAMEIEAGHGEVGERMLREVLTEMERTGGDAVRYARVCLAVRCGTTGRTAEARAHLTVLAEEFDRQPLALFSGMVAGLLGWLDTVDGHYADGLARLRQAVAAAQDPMARAVVPSLVPMQFPAAAAALAGSGAPEPAERAARLLGAYDAWRARGRRVPASEAEQRRAAERLVRRALGAVAYERGVAEGRELSVAEATALLMEP